MPRVILPLRISAALRAALPSASEAPRDLFQGTAPGLPRLQRRQGQVGREEGIRAVPQLRRFRKQENRQGHGSVFGVWRARGQERDDPNSRNLPDL